MHVGSGASIEDILCISKVLVMTSNPKGTDKDVKREVVGRKGRSGSPSSMAPTLRSASTIHASLRWIG